MKKVMLGFTACALLLTSCSQNDILENTSEANEIRFTTLNDRVVTKAANDADNSYGVYAIWSEATTAWYIENLEVTNEDNYIGAYYWPQQEDETVSFYAYAPYYNSVATDGGVTALPTTSELNITYKVKSTADEDFTIATPATDLSQNSTNFTNGKVQLTFNHMLSKIKIEPVLSEGLKTAGYSLDDTNITAKIGNVTIYNGTAKLSSTVEWQTTTAETATEYSKDKDGNWTFMILPQDTKDITIHLEGVKINKNNVEYVSGVTTAKYTFKESDTNIDAFEKNKFYTITLTIAGTSDNGTGEPIFGSKIEFSSAVSTWDTVSKEVEVPQLP